MQSNNKPDVDHQARVISDSNNNEDDNQAAHQQALAEWKTRATNYDRFVAQQKQSFATIATYAEGRLWLKRFEERWQAIRMLLMLPTSR